MHPRFINWLEKQEYDWNIPYNQKHKTQDGGRIWVLKHVHDYLYPDTSPYNFTGLIYEWNEIISL